MDWVLTIFLVATADPALTPGPREVGHMESETVCLLAGYGLATQLAEASKGTVWTWSCAWRGGTS